MSKVTTEEAVACTRAETDIRELSELIAALDRRVPRNERAGDVAITRSAAELKTQAAARIADLVQKSRR